MVQLNPRRGGLPDPRGPGRTASEPRPVPASVSPTPPPHQAKSIQAVPENRWALLREAGIDRRVASFLLAVEAEAEDVFGAEADDFFRAVPEFALAGVHARLEVPDPVKAAQFKLAKGRGELIAGLGAWGNDKDRKTRRRLGRLLKRLEQEF